MHLNIIKAIYDNPTASTLLSDAKLKVLPLRSETRRSCPLPPLLVSTVLNVLVGTIRYAKKSKISKLEGKK